MKAVTFTRHGGPEVLSLSERDVPEPGAGEVRVRIVVSAVNPTDWKSRRGPGELAGPAVPNQDGAGVVDAVGPGVTEFAAGDRVWVLLAAAHSPASGTARSTPCCPPSGSYACPTASASTRAPASRFPRSPRTAP